MKQMLAVILAALLLAGCARQPEADVSARALAEGLEMPGLSVTLPPLQRVLRSPKPIAGSLDENLFPEAEVHGAVTELFYETYDYTAGGSEPIQKRLVVYVPPGYDPAAQYPVLFLSHIMNWNENFWFWTDFDYPSPEGGYTGLYLYNLLDNMIAQGYCEPLLVVSVDNYLYEEDSWSHNSARTYPQFAREFAEDILPAVVENYSTHAEGSSREELAQARSHFGFLGASFGAYVTYNCLMMDCFDLVANFALTGGGGMEGSVLLNRWAALGHEDYSMDCLFFGQGEYDDRVGPEGAYYNLKAYDSVFHEENLKLILYPGLGHEERAWVNTIYNALQLFFR